MNHSLLFEHIPIPIIIIDQDYELLEINKAYKEVYGLNQILSMDDLSSLLKRKVNKLDFKVQNKELSISSLPLFDGSNHAIILEDITFENKIESEMINDRAKIIQESVNREVENTIIYYSHLLNNRISVLSLGLDLLKKNMQAGDMPYFDKAHSVIQDMISIIHYKQSILKNSASLQEFNLYDEIKLSFHSFGDDFRILGIDYSIDEQLKQLITYDKFCLQQVLIELIKNSIDAIKNFQEKWININLTKKSENSISLSFMDSGEGIIIDDPEQLFAAYFTTKEAKDGAGNGLYITRELLNNYQSQIIYNKECKNTEFIINLKGISNGL